MLKPLAPSLPLCSTLNESIVNCVCIASTRTSGSKGRRGKKDTVIFRKAQELFIYQSPQVTQKV